MACVYKFCTFHNLDLDLWSDFVALFSISMYFPPPDLAPSDLLLLQAPDRPGCYTCRKREAPDPRAGGCGVPAKVSHGHHHHGHQGQPHYGHYYGWPGHHHPIPGANKG